MHCYQPVGTMAVMLVSIGIIGEGETVVIAAVDHNDERLHYAIVSPLHPVEIGSCRNPVIHDANTILAGYDRFDWTWASSETLFFPDASELFPEAP